jgi:hypothetical protein
MNTGEAQEIALYETIKRELRKKRFGLVPECCRVYRRRAYFSRDRNAEIVFDISIEVTLRGALEPFFVWVWESKDYSSPLSVDNVEEFHAKLQQIGADKTKGTVALSGEIQKSALAFAISKGIGIAKFLPSHRIRWVSFWVAGVPLEVERTRFAEETLRSMTDPNFVANNRGFYAYTSDGKPFLFNFELFLHEGFMDVLDCDIWRTDSELAWKDLLKIMKMDDSNMK